MGESASPLLAVSHSGFHWPDGRKSARNGTDGPLRISAAHGCGGVFHTPERDHFGAGPGQCILAKALGRDRKGKLSVLLHTASVATAFVYPRISAGIYALVAIIWLIPDRRIERILLENENRN